MVHVRFDTSQIGYDDYVVQTGTGADGEDSPSSSYTYFRGSPPYQRGYGPQGGAGIGDVFRGLWRFFFPLIRRVGTSLSAEALNTGQRVLDKVVNEGQPLKTALIDEGKRGIDTVLTKGGLPKQFGTGKAIKRRRHQQFKLPQPHQTLIGRAVIPTSTQKPGIISSKKRLRSDAFGLY
jgi:hypothetical protein